MTADTLPPMGWNSWDSFGTTVTEEEVRSNAEVLNQSLAPFGWDTVVVDIAWYDPTARAHGYNRGAPIELDGFGRQLPAPGRFPSSRHGAGFAVLGRDLHAMDLKFGIHILRGVPRRAVELDLPIAGTEWTAAQIADVEHVCTWNPDNYGLNHAHPGAQAYYDSQVEQFASWGVDLIKADDMQAPFYAAEIEAYSRAIRRSGRPITLSLSPGTGLSTQHLNALRQHADMWRISDDLWDNWADLHAQFARLARWAPLQSAQGWADADMLPLGRIGVRAERGSPRQALLTLDEQRTLLTLWTMGRSPLMVGGDLPSSDETTLGLLRNTAYAALFSSVTDSSEIGREPVDDGEEIIWSARTPTGTVYAALFWTGAGSHTISVPLDSLGDVDLRRPYVATDLWHAGRSHRLPIGENLSALVLGHGVRWFILQPASALGAGEGERFGS